MITIDWIILTAFFIVLLGTGIWSYRKKVRDTTDFFVAGGKLPWWLAGISHHVSGHSGAVFVAYAALAYTYGISVWFWWALTIFTALMIGSFFLPPAWVRLRQKYHIQSPTEYLAWRYNIPTQQIIAWSGILLKLFDIAAKWAAMGILLNGFTGMPVVAGIILAGGISMIYVSLGGLWADVMNDFFQFIIQVTGGIIMLVIVVNKLGGLHEAATIWNRLPSVHSNPVAPPYTIWFVLTFLALNFLSYNGGTWNLATRFIAQSSEKSAKKSVRLSALLYLIWPFVLFYPMWCCPLLFPGLEDPEQSYAIMARELLPAGLVGLVLASMFANTLTMTSSDSNTITAVLSRDVIPVIFRGRTGNSKVPLRIARIISFTFILVTIIIALNASSFGGVLGLIISWFAALLGPVAIPMVLGILPAFNRMDYRAALAAIGTGFITFVVTKNLVSISLAAEIGSPVVVAFISFCLWGLLISGRSHKIKNHV